MRTRTGVWLVLIVAAVMTIGCDRVTKHLATTTLAGTSGWSLLGDTIRLAYAENTGGFLSLGANLPPDVRTALFTVGTGLMLLAAVAFAIQRRVGGWTLAGLTLFVAGGASNWLDRLLRGSVVDFLNVGIGPLRTGIFNVADVAIMLGVGIVFLAELRDGRGPRGREPGAPTDALDGDAPTDGVVDGAAGGGAGFSPPGSEPTGPSDRPDSEPSTTRQPRRGSSRQSGEP